MKPPSTTPSRRRTALAASAVVIVATVVAVIGTEIALRLAYPWLSGRVQSVIAHVRLWGGGGRALGPRCWPDRDLFCLGRCLRIHPV